MKTAAIGIRVHSGWGALVAVSGASGAEEVIDRRRVEIINLKTAGAKQPYHYAQEMALEQAEKHIAKCAAASAHLARVKMKETVDQLKERGYRVTGAAIMLGSGRNLPALAKILASHPLLHTAEGAFFRQAFRGALEALEIHVTGIPEKDLMQRAEQVLGKAALRTGKNISSMGKLIGPPWTEDQKKAMLAAVIVLGT
jgi:hypothetical protein